MQVIPQNKVNIGAYVSRCEAHRLRRSFEHLVRKPVHPMRHLNMDRHFDPGRMDFSSCFCGSQCLSVSYSPLVESLRWDRPVHKVWTRLYTYDNHLTICALRRCSATATELQQDLRRITGVTVSHQTVRKRLREVSLRPRRPVRVPRLTQQYRTARFLFAGIHVIWKLGQWRPILFTDESIFSLTQRAGRQRVCKRRGEQYMRPIRTSFRGGVGWHEYW